MTTVNTNNTKTSASNNKNKKKTTNSLFVSDAGRLTTPTFLFLIAGPLILSGNYKWGLCFICLAFGFAVKQSMDDMDVGDKLEIRYNALSWEDLVAELEQLEEVVEEEDEDKQQQQQHRPPNATASAGKKKQYLVGLQSLARKYDRRRTLPDKNERQQLALVCQQIAFTTLRLYGGGTGSSSSSNGGKKSSNTDDSIDGEDITTVVFDVEIVAGSISLLALLARDTNVRKRYKYQSSDYGLDVPIEPLKKVLKKAKIETDEMTEEVLAETLRKGCLYLGAVCNDDTELGLAEMITEQDGLDLIIETGNWFRLHEDVANWALWALFTLCYDRTRIKVQLVRLRGIPTICEIMKNNPSNLEVNRHGVALLFDLLRENQGEVDGVKWDPWEVRKAALNSGLHDVIVSCMNEFSDSKDIMIMGQEILIGTAYQGKIPAYQQVM